MQERRHATLAIIIWSYEVMDNIIGGLSLTLALPLTHQANHILVSKYIVLYYTSE
jgi:uncharacterized membrane protein